MNYQGMKRLQAAIVISAIADYKISYDNYQQHFANIEIPSTDYMTAAIEVSQREYLKELEKFFHSAWFEMINPIPGLTGDEILAHVRSDPSPELIIRCRRNILEGPRR